MNPAEQPASSQPRTAPHIAGLVVGALLVIFGLHFLGFTFVGSVSGGFGR